MKNQKNLIQIVEPLLQWYQINKRSLPWREDKNPYHVWISEIMLQQTRIEAVKKYYEKFMKELPTIQDLAEIEEERLLKLWEGLGYYNRARNLQKAAQIVQKEYNGIISNTYQELLKLPGIGEYTAGAIASISFNEKVPAVDGNVLRVVSRILGSKKDILLPETKKEVTKLLQEIMPEEAGDFNEALMELGELICLPNGNPNCEQCPLKQSCISYQEDLTSEIPVRENKTKRKQEEKTVIIFVDEEQRIAIQKRNKKGVLQGMYEFPNVEGKLKENEVLTLIQNWGLEVKGIQFLGEYQHIFTHITWNMNGYLIHVKSTDENEFTWVTKKQLQEEYALPTAFKQFLT